MADTDAAGVIYFGAPTRWLERLSTSWFRSVGFPALRALPDRCRDAGVHLDVQYAGPLRLDDDVDGELWAADRSRRAFTLRATFRRTGDGVPIVALLTQTFVRRAPDGRASAEPLPDTLIAALAVGAS